MNILTNAVGGLVVYGIGLLIAMWIISNLLELIRRWFFRVEYRCEKCNSRFTLMIKDHWDLCTGTLWKTRCLRCGTLSNNTYFYFRGNGQSMSGRVGGGGWFYGWRAK